MCDVGQGSAFLLRAAPDAAVVVDTGPDPEVIDRCLADAQVDTVPAIVLTHFHADHVGGLAGVLRGRAVGIVLTSPVREPADQVAAVERTLAAAGVARSEVAVGEERATGSLRWRVLWPRRRIADGSVANNGSVVLLAEVSGTRVLLTGDIETAAQTALGPDLRVAGPAVVTVPHHGSADVAANLAGWLRARVALVSVGADNEYGHPAARVLADWRAAGALVARTDESGDVAVVRGATGLGVVRRR
jgi:competence protein ComEC